MEHLIEERSRTGKGIDWESFCVYEQPVQDSPDSIFEGATGLPRRGQQALWTGLQHWCRALSEIRRVIPDADWSVHVEDHEIPWDEATQGFDPSL